MSMSSCNSRSNVSQLTGGGFSERNKKWQMELLMERLRSKSSQYKPLQDTSRSIRIAMLEKRYALDAVEKSNLQKCLDRMQYCIKVTTRQGLVERLESLSRQLGLKFSDDNLNLFISSDMFYLEIILDGSGKVHDVKVHHEFKMEQQSCQELVSCLLKGDFADFTAQLEGLTSIYQLNADKKTKSNAFVALQALESDLQSLYSLQSHLKDPCALVQSPVGILQSRRGGHPMRLTYCVPPYQLLDVENNTLKSLTVDLVNVQTSIGLSVTVHLEAASSNKLQIAPILKIQKDTQGNAKVEYLPLSADNSIMLPACFVLRLNKPIAIGVNLLRQIEQITRAKFPDDVISKSSPILSLITCHVTDGQINNPAKGLFVSLPDQTHCYFLTENHDLQGVIIKSIPFTEPSHVPQILRFLRQQALFNTLITSCIRTTTNKSDFENVSTFEINAQSCQYISITLEHPFLETMATIEMDLTDIPNINCNIFSLSGNYNGITTGLSRILRTCASIPVTIRTLIKYWERENANKSHGLDSSNLSLFLSQGGDRSGGNDGDHDTMKSSIKREHATNNINRSAYGDLENGTINNGDGTKSRNDFDSVSQQQHNNSGNGTSSMNFNSGCDDKAIKRRRTEDFGQSPKREPTNADDGVVKKSMETNSSSNFNSLGASSTSTTSSSSSSVANKSQRSSDDSTIFKESYRNPLSDDSKGMKISKSNADCDKIKLNKSDVYDSNGKRIDGANIGEPMKKKQKRQRDEKSSADGSSNLSPSVSITPITSSETKISSVLTGLERRPGIEIIPISSQPTQNLKSSITITPINSASKNSSSAGANSDKRCSTGANNGSEHSSKRSDDRLKLEKKKKRKREDSPMGPPEKMPLKQDPLSRPVTVSIKTSPKHSPHSGSSSSNSHSSPKHQSLPSPKGNHYSTSSPKHSSSAGSGKPSMSTLKSATSSPNSKSSVGSTGERVKTYSSSSSSSRDRQDRDRERDRDRDKDRERDRSYKYSSGSNSPKLKVSSVKLKQIDLNSAFIPMDSLIDASSSSQDSTKSSGSNQANKNRKGSLSAVIDKLKSARHVNDESPPNTPTLTTPSQSLGPDSTITSISASQAMSKEKTASTSSSQSLNLSNSPISITSLKNNSEYMVKHSSDGMKITINKTRTKDSSSPSSKQNYQHSSGSNSGGSGSNSPKTHTGLKPGVNSGPASKKPQSNTTSSTSNPSSGNISNSASNANVSTSNLTQSSNQMSSSSASFGSASIVSPSNSTLAPAASSSTTTTATKSLISKSSSSGALNSSSSGALSKTGSLLNSSSSSSSSSSMPKTSSTSSLDSYKKDKNRSNFKSGSGNGSDRPSTNRDVMKMLGLPGNPAQTLDGFAKSWDAKYQIPKLSARSSASDKDTTTTTTTTVAASPLSLQNQESSAPKSMMSFMSNVHSFGGNQMLSNKIHGGRASSVSPKYNLNADGMSNFNKDMLYKSSSSDALQHQSGSHHKQNMSFSNPTTPTTSSISQPPSSFSSSTMSFSHQLNNSANADIWQRSAIDNSSRPRTSTHDANSTDGGDGSVGRPKNSMQSNSNTNADVWQRTTVDGNARSLPNKSPMHSHSSSMNVTSKNLMSNALGPNVSANKNSTASTTSAPIGATSSTSQSPTTSTQNLYDQMKNKNRPPTKAIEKIVDFSSTSSLMNPSQLRTMQSLAATVSAGQTSAVQRSSGTNSPQVLLSSDDEIMDESLVGK